MKPSKPQIEAFWGIAVCNSSYGIRPNTIQSMLRRGWIVMDPATADRVDVGRRYQVTVEGLAVWQQHDAERYEETTQARIDDVYRRIEKPRYVRSSAIPGWTYDRWTETMINHTLYETVEVDDMVTWGQRRNLWQVMAKNVSDDGSISLDVRCVKSLVDGSMPKVASTCTLVSGTHKVWGRYEPGKEFQRAS